MTSQAPYALLATVVLTVSTLTTPSIARAPNVLLVMTDDQGFGDISSHGNSKLSTRTLDRLAEEGARFDRFYVSPVCAPTRASLLTGRYSLRTGVHGVTRGRENMRPEEVTLAELFRKAGYATGCFGKWHNGHHFPYHPNGQGFDEFFGFCAGHWNNYFDTGLERNGQPVETKGYIIDVLTDAALEFIETHRERPFLCYVPYNTPHTPWQVPGAYWETRDARGLSREERCAYAMCENIDANMSRLLSGLARLGLERDTIVVFLTDNGPNSKRFNDGMRGRKGSVDEGGVRVPLFVRWPGRIREQTRVAQIAQHIDLLPTLADLCGVSTEGTLPLDGRSLAPLLLEREGGKSVDWRERQLFTARSWSQKPRYPGSVRTQRFRAVRRNAKDAWQLFDMVADPAQTKSVAAEYPEVVDRLSKAYDSWIADVTVRDLEPLPIPIGHEERPVVELPGHEAELFPKRGEGISWVGRAGWANDWITEWTSTESWPEWPVEVVRAGKYRVELLYAAPEECVGTRLRIEAGSNSVEATLDEVHVAERVPSPDRIPRKEVYEQVWGTWSIGELQLEKSTVPLRVRALELAGGRSIDLKAVRLSRIDAD